MAKKNMKIKKESDFGELLFRIVVLALLVISFKPIYLYLNSFKKVPVQPTKQIQVEQIVLPEIKFNDNQKNNNTNSQNIITNTNIDIQPEKTLVKNSINIQKKLIAPKRSVFLEKVQNNKSQEADVLSVEQVNNYVEKINAYIDEQDYLLSNIDTENSSSGHVLKSIEKSIQDIENEIKDKKISNLINNTELKNLKLKIESYRQAIKQI